MLNTLRFGKRWIQKNKEGQAEIQAIYKMIGKNGSRFLWVYSLSVGLMLITGCSHAQKNGDVSRSDALDATPSVPLVLAPKPNSITEKSGPLELYGPEASLTGVVPPSEAPPIYVENPDKVVLILGTGYSSGFGALGVLKALQKINIPIQAIYASEVSALISSLYVTQPNFNRVDWSLTRFNQKNLFQGSGLHLDSPEEKLRSDLDEVFGSLSVEKLRTRVVFPLFDVNKNLVTYPVQGKVKDFLRCTLSGKNGFEPCRVQTENYTSPFGHAAEIFQYARHHEGYPIVYVHFGNRLPELFQKLIEGNHGLLLQIPWEDADDFDFKKRNQAVFLGRQVIEQNEKALEDLIKK